MSLKYVLLVLCVACLALSGCAAYNMPGPGQITPGFIVTSSSAPGAITTGELYSAHPEMFDVIGTVEGVSNSTNIFGLFSIGDSGYRAAVDDALAKSKGDGLINVIADVKQNSVLGIFSSSKTIVRGLAIKKKVTS